MWTTSKLSWKADQYSVGIILCKLFCGQIPYIENDPSELLEAQKETKVNPGILNPDISPNLNLIICKMCAYATQDRYEHPLEILDDMKGAFRESLTRIILNDEKTVVVDLCKKSTHRPRTVAPQ